MDKEKIIPLMKTAFFNEEETCKRLADFINTIPRLSMGDKCREFEKAFAKYQSRKYCILVNSGGSANFLLLQALKNMGKIKTGDNIAFSSLTWSTNVMPIIQHGMNPIPLDCSISELNVTVDILREAIKKRKISAFFSTNVLGFASDLAAIKELCKESNILFIEDNCESLGTEVNGIKTGNFGLASTFSFFVAHHMSTIEGGAICTDDVELAKILIMSRANGWDRSLSFSQQQELRNKHGIESEFKSKYVFYELAFNFRPTEITGFIGLEQLKYIEEMFKTREKNYLEVAEVMKLNPELKTVNTNHLSFVSNFSIPVISDNIDKYINRFKDKVEIRPLICGSIVKQPFWRKYIGMDFELPGTNYLHKNSFYFGNYPEMTQEDINIIKGLLRG